MSIHRVILLVLAAFLLPLAAWAASAASGTVTVGKDTLKAQSAIAVWSPQTNRLTVSVFPFKLTRDQRDALDRFPADYTVADFPTQKPFFRVDIEFKPGSRGPYRAEDVRFTNFSAWRMGDATMSSQKNGPQGTLEIQGDFRNLKEIRFSARGGNDFEEGRKPVRWDVQARCRVYRQKTLDGAR